MLRLGDGDRVAPVRAEAEDLEALTCETREALETLDALRAEA